MWCCAQLTVANGPSHARATHPVARLIERLEGGRVRGHVGRVDIVADTRLSVGSPGAHAVLLFVGTILGSLTDKRGESVAPT